MTTDIKPEPTGEETIVPAEIDFAEFAMAGLFTGQEGEANGWLDFAEPPILIIDTDPERVLARLQEMMAYAFEGIGEEKKEEKRLGLALQHLDIEQRHALRLLLQIYRQLGRASDAARLFQQAQRYVQQTLGGDLSHATHQAFAGLFSS